MRTRFRRSSVLFLGVAWALLAGCGPPRSALREIPVPAAPGSAEPCVEAGGDGRVYLSWIEPAATGAQSLRFCVWEHDAWSAPRSAASGSDWFVNWADFPGLTALDDGTLAAHWLRKTDPGTYAYEVALAFSKDGGAHWSEPRTPHDDSPTEHGFVSKVPLPGGRLAVIWLDGRRTGGGGEEHAGPMTLRSALIGANGRLEREDEIDARVCDCCQTSAARLDDGTLVVAYRDRSEAEVRDIAVARFDGEHWSEAKIVHADHWVMPGCPVNGPALAVDGKRVAVAWFTAAADKAPAPRVKLAFSNDGGRSFEDPIDVDEVRPEGRVDVAFVDDGAALVTWLATREGTAEIMARRVARNGFAGPPVRIASTSAARASGFPRMASLGSEVLIAWTGTGDHSTIRSARVRIEP